MYTSTPADVPDPPFRFFEGLVPRLFLSPPTRVWEPNYVHLASTHAMIFFSWLFLCVLFCWKVKAGRPWGTKLPGKFVNSLKLFVIADTGLPYHGKFPMVRNFAEMSPHPSEAFFAVFIFTKPMRDSRTTPLP